MLSHKYISSYWLAGALAGFFVSVNPVLCGDIATLKSGRTLEGEIVEVTEETVSFRVVKGDLKATLHYSRDEVKDIEEGLSPEQRLEKTYEERLIVVSDSSNADDWYALGNWASVNYLRTRAESAFRKALGLDPGHEDARRALGFKLYEGEWFTLEEIMLKKGFIRYDNTWMTPEERDGLIAGKKEEKRLKAELKAKREEAGKVLRKMARERRNVPYRAPYRRHPLRFKQDYWPWYPNVIRVAPPVIIRSGSYIGCSSPVFRGLSFSGEYNEGSTRIQFRFGY